MMNEIIVAGAGTGSAKHMTSEVIEAIRNSDFIFAASRLKKLIPAEKTFYEIRNFDETFTEIENSDGRILILLSGDAGFYSLLPLIKKRFPNTKIKVLSGISSLQMICSRAGEVWSGAKILSGHGRVLNMGFFLNIIERERLTVLLCDKKNSPDFICKNLAKISGNCIEVYIGENLGSDDEKFLNGSPKEFLNCEFSELSIMLIKNHDVYKPQKSFLDDKDFLREKNIVMTNENVRAVIISKLAFHENSLFWDIGAGSGSVSICAAHENPFSLEIHSVECNPEAVNLILRNAGKFRLHNINIHAGRAVNIIKNLPEPTHVFIGGSDGELPEILEFLSNLEKPVKIVIASVTLETFSTAYEIMKDMSNFEAVQIAVTTSKNLNEKLTLMHANNPVMLLSALTK